MAMAGQFTELPSAVGDKRKDFQSSFIELWQARHVS
jgi:hypothetical protein